MANGEESRDPGDIKDMFLKFWGGVFGDEHYANGEEPEVTSAARHKLTSCIKRQLTHDEQTSIDEPISAEELSAAIKRMRGCSAPGLDGLPACFYQTSPDTFGSILKIVFADQLRRGILLRSQRKTCISLLHKKGDRRVPENYRLIALMNVDVKALTKALAGRMNVHLPRLVHEEQQSFVAGRSLHHQVRFMEDLKYSLAKRNEAGYALFLDFEKAYDRVDWTYLLMVLERMGFGPTFRRWIEILYRRPLYLLMLNGYLEGPTRPQRGVKQGDPLSPLLSVLALEPMAELLRDNTSGGIICDGQRSNGVYFADDSTILSKSLHDLEAQLSMVRIYCEGSGARVNLTKSSLVALNPTFPLHGSGSTTFHRVRDGESIWYLGIPFGTSFDFSATLQCLDSKLFERLRLWQYRARTVRGRLLIARSIILSCIWFYAMHVTYPQRVIRRWQTMVNRFVLSRCILPEKRVIQLIKSDFLYLRREDGGMQFPSVTQLLTSQRFRFLQRFVDVSTQPSTPHWVRPSHELLSGLAPRLGTIQLLDFLSISPNRLKFLLDLGSLTPWWVTTWKLWNGIKWPVTDPSRQEYMKVQIWINRAPEFQTPTRNGSRMLLAVTEAERNFRLAFARDTRAICLSDFQVDNEWPTFAVFWNTFRSRVHGNLLVPDNRWIRLYNEITNIHRQLKQAPTGAVANGALPPVGCEGSKQTEWSPHISKANSKRLFAPKKPTGPHPTRSHVGNWTQEHVLEILRFHWKHQRLVFPVYADVWY